MKCDVHDKLRQYIWSAIGSKMRVNRVRNGDFSCQSRPLFVAKVNLIEKSHFLISLGVILVVIDITLISYFFVEI